MNKTSTDKIKSATSFLIWFRRCLPQGLQAQIRSYLERPYQLALNVLDCCDSTRPLTVGEIAQSAGIAQETARQVLQALKEGGMPFAVSPTRGWQPVRDDGVLLAALTPLTAQLELQEQPPEYLTTGHG